MDDILSKEEVGELLDRDELEIIFDIEDDSVKQLGKGVNMSEITLAGIKESIRELKNELAILNKNIATILDAAGEPTSAYDEKKVNIPNDISFKSITECKTYLELLGYKGFAVNNYISSDSLVTAKIVLKYPYYDINFESVYK